MSEYYKPQRKRNLYDPKSTEPFKISRSKIEAFMKCRRCFYLDRRLGVGQSPGFPFNLNSAVDELLKKEFDQHRALGTAHPLMLEAKIDAIPFGHEKMDEWRDALHRGVQVHHQPTNLILTGGIDDVWITPAGDLIIVDYKATSKDGNVSLDAEWQNSYKRQMDIYSWLFRQSGFKVHKTGYFVYCNGKKDRPGFNGRLEFDISVLPYEIDDSWVDGTILELKEVLDHDSLPESGENCDHCGYFETRKQHEVE